MTEMLQNLLTWAPSFIVLTILLAALVFFGFLMGRTTQDKPIVKHKTVTGKKISIDLPDGDLFREAMQGKDKDERIATIKP